jgi:hypothetical protein
MEQSIREYQEKLKCGICFFGDKQAFITGNPCCTYPQSIAEFINESTMVCGKYRSEV